MHDIPLGPRVRALRRQQDWTQRQLALRAGINHITISRLEHGDSAHVYAETIVALARALGCTTDYLLGLEEEGVSLVRTQRQRNIDVSAMVEAIALAPTPPWQEDTHHE